jgi:hypothetical protein
MIVAMVNEDAFDTFTSMCACLAEFPCIAGAQVKQLS